MIQDEYTYRTDISRQRKYQLRKRDAGKCIKCGANRTTAHFCEKHAAEANELAKQAYHRKLLIPKDLVAVPAEPIGIQGFTKVVDT